MTERRGRLFIVSTPIGNMGDLTFRAVEVLRSVAAVLAEDTRHSRPLLERYEITTPLESHHEHKEARATPGIVARLEQGDDIALISDAGTPLLSDPGGRLVAAAVERGIEVVPIPGASALLAALVASGLPADTFTFLGFPPRRGRERAELLGEVTRARHTCILYEAPSRVAATLAELAGLGAAERPAAVARELTKRFEEVRRGTVAELATYYEGSAPRGEVVIVIGAGAAVEAAASEEVMGERARELRAGGLSVRDTAARLAGEFGIPRNAAYRIASARDGA